MASSIINENVTYASLIDSAATILYNKLSSSSVKAGVYRDNAFTFAIGGVGTSHHGVQKYNITLRETENRSEDYTSPTKAKIVTDITSFMNGVNIPTNNTTPTSDGMISFLFALNFFVEKAIIKRAITAPNNSASSYHLHYKEPSASSYKNSILYTYDAQNSVTTEKIDNIYYQLKTTSLLSDNARKTNIKSAAHTSSCSSSSCSSVFIAYFNLH